MTGDETNTSYLRGRHRLSSLTARESEKTCSVWLENHFFFFALEKLLLLPSNALKMELPLKGKQTKSPLQPQIFSLVLFLFGVI